MSDTENTRLREEVAQLTKEVERVWEVGKALVAFEREVNARLAKERDEARSRFEEAFDGGRAWASLLKEREGLRQRAAEAEAAAAAMREALNGAKEATDHGAE